MSKNNLVFSQARQHQIKNYFTQNLKDSKFQNFTQKKFQKNEKNSYHL